MKISDIKVLLNGDGEERWEIILDLSDYEEDDDEILLDDATDLWGPIFWLGQAGVDARFIAGSCGLCDEFHAWLAAPVSQTAELLRRVRDGDIRNTDVAALHALPGVRVRAGREKILGRVGNSAGGWYERVEIPITVIISGRDNHNGVYRFVDSIFAAPAAVGGNSGQVRDLATTWKGW